MKYICTLNGKKYEVQVEKLDDFTPLTRAAAAAPAATAAAAPTATRPQYLFIFAIICNSFRFIFCHFECKSGIIVLLLR